jgi:DNA-directed RNA polymerase subunit RPC12/RpoP
MEGGVMAKVNLKRYGLYLVRWQLSTPILAVVLYMLSGTGKIMATTIANLIGGLIFFWGDKFIFTSGLLSVQWEVRDAVVCVDCGKEARGYRIVKAAGYDKSRDVRPEFRCEECSKKKTEELRRQGIEV